VDLGESSERALDAISIVNPVDTSLEGIEVLLIGVVVLVVVIVVLIPVLLFGLELILLGLLVAAGTATRALFGRPWLVQACPSEGSDGALAWEVKGWRRSGELIEEVATELAAGHTPSPVRLGGESLSTAQLPPP
jgi:hypothetical protein